MIRVTLSPIERIDLAGLYGAVKWGYERTEYAGHTWVKTHPKRWRAEDAPDLEFWVKKGGRQLLLTHRGTQVQFRSVQ